MYSLLYYLDSPTPNPMSNRPSLWRQLLGAVIGGGLGLGVYMAYQTAEPHFTAWTSIPQKWVQSVTGEGSAIADRDRSTKTQERFASRAREIAQKFGVTYQQYRVQEEVPVQIHPTDIKMPVTGTENEATDTADIPPISPEQPSWVGMRTETVPDSWENSATEKRSGPDAPTLPDSGVGALGAAVVSASVALGLRRRKRS
jgi:hypothetical protein